MELTAKFISTLSTKVATQVRPGTYLQVSIVVEPRLLEDYSKEQADAVYQAARCKEATLVELELEQRFLATVEQYHEDIDRLFYGIVVLVPAHKVGKASMEGNILQSLLHTGGDCFAKDACITYSSLIV